MSADSVLHNTDHPVHHPQALPSPLLPYGNSKDSMSSLQPPSPQAAPELYTLSLSVPASTEGSVDACLKKRETLLFLTLFLQQGIKSENLQS